MASPKPQAYLSSSSTSWRTKPYDTTHQRLPRPAKEPIQPIPKHLSRRGRTPLLHCLPKPLLCRKLSGLYLAGPGTPCKSLMHTLKHRRRFSNLRKTSSQTHADFKREKGMLVDRRCSACRADNLTSVHELMLLEEFKDCLPERVVIYLNEQ